MDETLKALGIDLGGLSYDDLTGAEHETLKGWLDTLNRTELTVGGIREYILSMRDSVEQELTKPNLDKQTDILLKARLRNYMLLEGFLMTPERAKKGLERALSNLKNK